MQELYWNLITKKDIKEPLNKYEDFLKLVCDYSNYNPVLKDIIYAIAISKKDIELIKYFKNIEYIDDTCYKSLHDSRICHFNLDSEYLKNLIFFIKKTKFHHNSISYIPSIIITLSTNFTKYKENKIWDNNSICKKYIQTFIAALEHLILIDSYKYDDLNELEKINYVLGSNFKKLYPSYINIKEIYQEYIKTFYKTETPLTYLLVFISYFLKQNLLNPEKLDIEEFISNFNKAFINNNSLNYQYYINTIKEGIDNNFSIEEKAIYIDKLNKNLRSNIKELKYTKK